jgi:hypothetical protein
MLILVCHLNNRFRQSTKSEPEVEIPRKRKVMTEVLIPKIRQKENKAISWKSSGEVMGINQGRLSARRFVSPTAYRHAMKMSIVENGNFTNINKWHYQGHWDPLMVLKIVLWQAHMHEIIKPRKQALVWFKPLQPVLDSQIDTPVDYWISILIFLQLSSPYASFTMPKQRLILFGGNRIHIQVRFYYKNYPKEKNYWK